MRGRQQAGLGQCGEDQRETQAEAGGKRCLWLPQKQVRSTSLWKSLRDRLRPVDPREAKLQGTQLRSDPLWPAPGVGSGGSGTEKSPV